MDRDHGRITLIPNIRISGTGEDFALLLPTPSIPEVASVPDTIWDQAFALTAPQSIVPRGGLGCSQNVYEGVSPSSGPENDGVDVLRQTHVGSFLVTTVQAADPNALLSWLNENGFTLDPEAAEKFRPYTDRHWVFCAMRLDPTAVRLGPTWDVSVDPIAFTFEANQFEVPLGLLSVNRDVAFKMFFFILDDHRSTLPDFQTTYANRISPLEFAAIRTRYPELSVYLKPNHFLTRLDRTFPEDVPMQDSIFLTRAEDDREYRRPSRGWVMSGDLLLGSILVAVTGARRKLRASKPRLDRERPA
jgi:hypothetical protein